MSNGIPILDSYLKLLFLVIIAYLAGSVNFAIILFTLTGREDPRTRFSGNPGATNVYRTAGPQWALMVLLLDAGRAIAVALLARWLIALPWLPWVALALIAGNRYPCFHGFKGGKGVANYLGFCSAVTPVAAGLSILAWGGVFVLLRVPFLSSFSMVAVLTVGMVQACGTGLPALAGIILTAIFIIISHRRNLTEFFRLMGDPRR